MAAKSNLASQSALDELVITRTYDAPRALVFSAWTEPEHLKHWWAPDGCSLLHYSLDLRPGGKRKVGIHTPGADYWAVGTYREVVVPERLVYLDALADANGNPVRPSHYGMSDEFPTESLVTVTFAEQGRRTVVTLRQTVPKAFPERQAMEEGWHEMFARLAQNLVHT